MPQGLTALHHFEELQLQKLQTVGSTNCELSCGIRIAVDLHQRKCQHMRDEKKKNSPHRCIVASLSLVSLLSRCFAPRVDLWRWIAPAKTFPPSTKFRQNFHMFFTFLTRCTLGMKRLELPQKRPEKCSFHRLSSNFHWFPQS